MASTLLTQVSASEPKESKTRYYRHEVNVSIGSIRVCSAWSNDYERGLMNKFGLVAGISGSNGVWYEWQNEPDLETRNALKAVSYYYHFNHHIATGGLFAGCSVRDWLGYPAVYMKGEIQKTGFTDVLGTSVFLMPSVKWSWLNNRWCSLYMKATAGFNYQSPPNGLDISIRKILKWP